MPPPRFISENAQGGTQFVCNVNSRADGKHCVRCLAWRGASYRNAKPTGATHQCSRNTCLSTPFCWQHLRSVCRLRVAKSMHMDSIGVSGLGLVAWHPPSVAENVPVFTAKRWYRNSRASAHQMQLEQNKIVAVKDGRVKHKYKRVGEYMYVQQPDLIFPGFWDGEFSDMYEDDDHNLDVTLYDGERVTDEELNRRYDAPPVQRTGPYTAKDNAHNYDAACKRGAGSFANDARRPKAGGGMKLRKRDVNVALLRTRNLLVKRDIRHGEELLWDYGTAYWSAPHPDHSTGPHRVGDYKTPTPRIPKPLPKHVHTRHFDREAWDRPRAKRKVKAKVKVKVKTQRARAGAGARARPRAKTKRRTMNI
jgi:hypothetical protein